MDLYDANTEYKNALKAGQREYRTLTAKGLDPHPQILEKLIENVSALPVQTIGIREIPIERIVGVKTEGRITAFSASFMPLLEPGTEFASKWISLCADHLSDTGIRDPIECYEYLGDFYVQEGNKRLSVLRHFGAPSIMASIKRILPPQSDEPRIKAYYEFLDFYKLTELYLIQYRKPGDYAKLLALLGKKPDEVWTEQERSSFQAYFHYFQKAFNELDSQQDADMHPEDALLLWLSIHRFETIGTLSAAELKKSLSELWDDVRVGAPVQVTEMPEAGKKGLIESIISPDKLHIQVAFVHQRDVEISPWTKAHEQAREYLGVVLGDRVSTKSYFNADTVESALSQIEQAVLDGAEVVFTTTPSLLRPTLKLAVQYPKVRFFNCSADVPFSSVHGYYCRAYEGKFITGAIAGAMTKGDEIGYIASYPILGVPASINAFALGAQMTNPRARVILRWSCVAGDPLQDFLQQGITVISNRDVPMPEAKYLQYGAFGTFQVEDGGAFTPLGSPFWLWGSFYERAIRGILAGTIDRPSSDPEAINYWLGMDSGAVDVALADALPDGVRFLAHELKRGLQRGELDPFLRPIRAQDGETKNDGSQVFSADEILHMDWLGENVVGSIPQFDELLPISQGLVRELGVYKDDIPPETENGKL